MAEATHQLSTAEREARPGELLGAHDASGLRIALGCARFNDHVTGRLVAGALEALDRHEVPDDQRAVVWVPGAFELPLAAQALANTGGFDAVVCLGAVIRGETSHYDFVAGECAAGLQRVQLDCGLPIIFGVLTTENLDQALERSGGSLGNKGDEAVVTAIEMVNVLRGIAEIGSASRSASKTRREESRLVAGTAGPQA
jgi:6,7-dimethyl-8-ribityllumazine synthase